MKINRPPRTWSAAPAAAVSRSRIEQADADSASDVEAGPLRDALGAYTAVDAELAADGAPPVREPALPAESSEESTVSFEANPVAAVDESQGVAAVPMLSVVAPTHPADLDELMARLERTRRSIGDAVVYCSNAADEVAGTAESFALAAEQLRTVAAEHAALDTMIASALDGMVEARGAVDALHARALEEATTMLEVTTREADAMRATALADVERARERLLRFTAEIGSVASELQGGLGKGHNEALSA